VSLNRKSHGGLCRICSLVRSHKDSVSMDSGSEAQRESTSSVRLVDIVHQRLSSCCCSKQRSSFAAATGEPAKGKGVLM